MPEGIVDGPEYVLVEYVPKESEEVDSPIPIGTIVKIKGAAYENGDVGRYGIIRGYRPASRWNKDECKVYAVEVPNADSRAHDCDGWIVGGGLGWWVNVTDVEVMP